MAQMTGTGIKQPYHLVDPSPWPIIGAISAFILALGGLTYMHPDMFGKGMEPMLTALGPWKILIGLALVLFTMAGWWRDVIKESMTPGLHSAVVRLGLRYGMFLFIASEVMFFVAFFWAFFHFALFPEHTASGTWPPKGVHVFDPWDLPFLNTLILLTSGVTVTWAHHVLPGLRVFARRLRLQGRHLLVDLLHGDRLPRLPRHRRHHLPCGLPRPCAEGPVHAGAPFRLRGGGVVLALRRRGLAVPVHLHLCRGLRRCRSGGRALTAGCLRQADMRT
jgi:hypothetical protein